MCNTNTACKVKQKFFVGLEVLIEVVMRHNNVQYVESEQTFWRNTSPPSSGLRNKLSKKPA
jgi:hypothetical protein